MTPTSGSRMLLLGASVLFGCGAADDPADADDDHDHGFGGSLDDGDPDVDPEALSAPPGHSRDSSLYIAGFSSAAGSDGFAAIRCCEQAVEDAHAQVPSSYLPVEWEFLGDTWVLTTKYESGSEVTTHAACSTCDCYGITTCEASVLAARVDVPLPGAMAGVVDFDHCSSGAPLNVVINGSGATHFVAAGYGDTCEIACAEAKANNEDECDSVTGSYFGCCKQEFSHVNVNNDRCECFADGWVDPPGTPPGDEEGDEGGAGGEYDCEQLGGGGGACGDNLWRCYYAVSGETCAYVNACTAFEAIAECGDWC